MQSNKSRDTSPELAVRRILHAQGLRYRVHYAPLPSLRRRRADIVFTRARVAVFIDGCFWHACPEHGTRPKSHEDYWHPKLVRNAERDRETDAALLEAGWTVLRYWEHQTAEEVAAAIAATIRP